MALYWLQFEGLREALQNATDPVTAFVDWFTSGGVTSPKTIQNRAMELQRENPELDSNAVVRAKRNIQGRAGPVGV